VKNEVMANGVRARPGYRPHICTEQGPIFLNPALISFVEMHEAFPPKHVCVLMNVAPRIHRAWTMCSL